MDKYSEEARAPKQPPKPSYRFMEPPATPALAYLKTFHAWVCFKYTWKEEKRKWDKPPKEPNGAPASHSDPITWSDYDAVVVGALTKCDGIGYVLHEGDDLTATDIDHCFNPDGTLQDWAQEIVNYAETYFEKSPSGEGLRGLARGKVSKAYISHEGQVEIYSTKRYVTITGNHLPGTPDSIEPAPKTIAALIARVERFAAEKKKSSKNGEHDGQPRYEKTFWDLVNDAALENIAAWAPSIFPDGQWQATGAYRVSSKALGRDLEEDFSIHPGGIMDFGEEIGMTAIDVVMKWCHHETRTPAAFWLCTCLQLDPEALGYKPTDDEREAELQRLADMTPFNYAFERKAAAKRLGIGVSFLDAAVAKRRKEERPGGQGTRLDLNPPDPWEEPVNGAELLIEIVTVIKTYVILQDVAGYHTIALWILSSHGYSLFQVFARLLLKSPDPGCGKSTLVDVAAPLANKPVIAEHATVAALFRLIEQHIDRGGLTVLLDEADSFMKDNEEMRGLINSGHKKGGQVLRVVGEDLEPRAFGTYCPVVMASISKLPATIEGRSIIIELQRKKKSEKVKRWVDKYGADLKVLARKCARWIVDNSVTLAAADPEIPEKLSNRRADNWRPLIAVADCAGGEWPVLARDAALGLAGGAENSLGVQLLADIRAYFQEFPDPPYVSSEDLICRYLLHLDDRPWATINRGGRPIDNQRLARMLKEYGVRTREVCIDGKGVARWRLEDLVGVFEKYVDES